ncbi:MAG: HD domain-containing protein [bacterium]|nr:HD domain-containing protein [bacterium]
MPTVIEIYQKYNIMPQLQLHQLRVAGVAKLICDNFPDQLDTDGVIKACLVHDMGNILKFDLTLFPESLAPEGLVYWENVKKEISQKYKTKDEHEVTRQIAKELNLPTGIQDYLNSVGFLQTSSNVLHDHYENKICCYADMRVTPFGIVSAQERLAEGKKRYQGTSHAFLSDDQFDQFAKDLIALEEQIFKKTRITPDYVTDQTAANIIDELKTFSF